MKFTIDDILITEFSFRREQMIDFDKEYDEVENGLNIGSSISIEGTNIIVKLTAEIVQSFQERTLVEGKVVIIGVFKTDGNGDEKQKENFASINAPAILFPYVREAISSASVKSGLPPVLIQPVNFVEMSIQDNNKK